MALGRPHSPREIWPSDVGETLLGLWDAQWGGFEGKDGYNFEECEILG